MTVRIVKVIFCDEARLGKGTEDDYVRRIPALYTLNGKLICSYDVGGAQERKPYWKQHVNGDALSGLA